MLELYIANRKADIPENFSVLYNYNSKDLSDPTAVKNKFSTTITLSGTPANTKIFGDIWKLDRTLIPSTNGVPGPYDTGRLIAGINFDPRKRVDFKIFNNSELIENGYLQLLEVKYGLSETTYRLQLYGGLGDFFYNLQYDEDNVEKNLGSLYYNWRSTPQEENTGKLGIWDRNFISESWSRVGTYATDNLLEEDITAIPTYSGKYEDFSSNKVLVNVPSINSLYSLTNVVFPSSITDDGNTYSLYNGKYALVETPRGLSEWEARDLRSTQQRIGLRFSSFFNAISDPQNNGGYNVVLDPKIKDDTPYFYRSWILLDRPQFETMSSNSNNLSGFLELNDGDSLKQTNLISSLYTNFDNTSYSNSALVYDFNFFLDFKMDEEWFDNHYQPVESAGTTYEHVITGTNRKKIIWDFVGLRFEMRDAGDDSIIDNSPTYIFTCAGTDTTQGYIEGTPPGGIGYIPELGKTRLEVYNKSVALVKQEVVNTLGGTQKTLTHYTFDKTDYSVIRTGGGVVNEHCYSDSSFTLVWENMAHSSNFKIRAKAFKLRLTAETSDVNGDPNGWTWTTSIGDYRQWYTILHMGYAINNPTRILGYQNDLFNQKTEFLANYAYLEDFDAARTSPYGITKKTLFGNTKTPLKYLLDWTKIFDLRFRLDSFSKTIYIEKRDTYYQNEIYNLRVDLSKNISINPTVAKYKGFYYGLPVAETYASTLYNRKTSNPYGRTKFNTGYEFNNDINDLYKDSVYQNLIPYTQSSYYFSHRGTGDLPPCVLSPTYVYNLYKTGGSNETYSTTLTNSWNYISNTYSYYFGDPNPKLCIFSADDSYVDGINSIVLYCGTYQDYETTISDTTQEMLELNSEPCYILSRDQNEVILNVNFPIFLNSYFNSTTPSVYQYSYNFSKPEVSFQDSEREYLYKTPVYSRFWEDYTKDLYNENGKTIQVYAFVEGKPEEMMRKFWYFSDAMWVINEIKNFNISDPNTPVQMTLVRVDDPENYLNNY